MDNPCRDCEYRHIRCHVKCEVYHDWKRQNDRKNKAMKRDRVIDDVCYQMDHSVI